MTKKKILLILINEICQKIQISIEPIHSTVIVAKIHRKVFTDKKYSLTEITFLNIFFY